MAPVERQELKGGPLPPAWQGLIGHAGALAAWRELLAADSLPPVLLLTGRAGIGKRGLLAALAAMHLCEQGTACGVCESCTWLLAGRHPELLWLAADSAKLLVEDASALQDHLELCPTPPARWRLAVVANADQMSVPAANRLLKTLEEPPPRARILLSTSRVGAMLPTVLSRCVRWRLPPPPPEVTEALLAERCAAAGRPVPTALGELVRLAGLAPGRALRLAGLGDGEAALDEPDLSPLLAASTPAQIIAAAERLGRQGGWSVPALLAQLEIELNRSYREVLGQPAARPRALTVAHRRDLLRQARRLAVGGSVPLNAQLALEALAFAGRAP